MNKEMKDDYEKALKLYHRGELKKSLKCCEEGLSKNLKNKSVLNLKGLILYLKGDLEGAITVWKINKDFNDDEISKAYIKDAENDKVRQMEFEKAQSLIKDFHINEAIESLNICKESDFNSIQVNNLLALCEFSKGEYDKSREYINKSLEIDKRDRNALDIKKELDEFIETKSKKSLVAILLICTISISVIIIWNFKNTEDKLLKSNDTINIQDKENDNDKIKDKDEFEEKIVDKNNEESKENEEATETMSISADEIEESYIRASTYFGEGNYLEAKKSLEKVVKQSVGNHLNDDILFLIGSTYEKLDDINNFIKYFEEYISLYENGDYIEEVYYKLAIQYKGIDNNKSKDYANKLIYNYSESIYNNSNIDSILVN